MQSGTGLFVNVAGPGANATRLAKRTAHSLDLATLSLREREAKGLAETKRKGLANRANAQATGGPRGELAKYRSQKTAAGNGQCRELVKD